MRARDWSSEDSRYLREPPSPYGSAEENFGRILASDLRPYRDELVISSKAGYDMWPGPYGGP